MQKSFQQKKWGSFIAAVLIVALGSMLTGCGKSEEQKPAPQKTDHVRKPGESGFRTF